MGTKAVGGANGKHGRVIFYNSDPGGFGSFELCVTEWSLTEQAEEVDTTNSCSAGRREFDYGAKWVEGRFTLDLDLAAHPLDDPPNLVAGQLVNATVYLHEHITDPALSFDNGFWTLSSFRILSVEVTVPSAGKVTYVINWKNSGTYTFTPQTASA
jgi:hypothetical protein